MRYCADDGEGDAVAQDVADELKECEDQHQHNEAAQHQEEHEEELADDVFVEDAGKGMARGVALHGGKIRASTRRVSARRLIPQARPQSSECAT